MALSRFVAKKAGLAGKTEAEEVYADVILEHVNDFIKGGFFQQILDQ
jgi:hypothetical protein